MIAAPSVSRGNNNVLTDTNEKHPWARFYSERGQSRPPMAVVVVPTPAKSARAKAATTAKENVSVVSTELAAAVAAVTAQQPVVGATAAPFITAMQREAVAIELKRRARVRMARFAAVAALALVAVHFAVTQLFNRAPSEEALAEHLQTFPETVLALYSSQRQPLQADGVVLSQSDRIDAQHFRYVATITLRLREPLYVPAATNGTATYRRLQTALQTAREQEMRFNLFPPAQAPDFPTLPLLLQRSHFAGETIVVRVPFTAQRFGWQWRLEKPELRLRLASRALEGDSLGCYGETPHLIFGSASALATIRERTKLAHNYVFAVAREVQRHADGEATPDLGDLPAALADLPAQPASSDPIANAVATDPDRPAFDPNAPAIVLPVLATLADGSRGSSQ
jgi:hypothetical protein